jgi:hypothetical protein
MSRHHLSRRPNRRRGPAAVCLWLGLILPIFAATHEPLPPPTSVLVELTAAARAVQPKDIRARLDRVDALLDRGAPVDELDGLGRNVLHWAVIATGNATRKAEQERNIEVLEHLLRHGADPDGRDVFGNTPLDYEDYSPYEIVQDLLLEAGADGRETSTVAYRLAVQLQRLEAASAAGDLAEIRNLLRSGLPIGTNLEVRLTTPVGSARSRAGDLVEGVIIAPVVVAGQTAIRPGTQLRGTVLRAQKCHNSYDRSDLVMDMCDLILPGGTHVCLTTRLLAVDNARETVRDGQIIGIAYPHNTANRVSMGFHMLGKLYPAVGYAFDSAMYAFGKTYHREIDYPAGTELTVQLQLPADIGPGAGGPAWPELPAGAEASEQILRGPFRTQSAGGVPGDYINLLLLGTAEQIGACFEAAGWCSAEKVGMVSSTKTFLAVLRQKGYDTAPVSTFLLDGRPPDLVFQKQLNTFAKRHHVRLWRLPGAVDGSPAWLAAATHDVGIGAEKAGLAWYHKIDPHIDRERDKIAADLMFTGLPRGVAWVDRPELPQYARNATGDELITDARILLLAFPAFAAAEPPGARD